MYLCVCVCECIPLCRATCVHYLSLYLFVYLCAMWVCVCEKVDANKSTCASDLGSQLLRSHERTGAGNMERRCTIFWQFRLHLETE